MDGVSAALAWPSAGEGGGWFACSFVGVDEGRYVLVDPDEEEEELATGRCVVVVDAERRVRWLYSGGIGLGRGEIKKCVELAERELGICRLCWRSQLKRAEMSN